MNYRLPMFRKLRTQIIAAIMSILLSVFAGVLATIYLFSYNEILSENISLMEKYSNEHGINPNGPNMPKFSEAAYKLSAFYTVRMNNSGQVDGIDNDNSSGISDEDLTSIAQEILQSGKTSGVHGYLLFLVKETKQGHIIVFMNNTIADDNFMTLFRYALIFGSIALAVLFLFSIYLSGKMIKPLETSFIKQKQFISDAGHELKTPLSTISANAEILEREVGKNKWLANIQSENLRMSGLVYKLLQLASMEDCQTQFSKVDLSRTVLGAALPFESVAFEKNIEISFDIPENVSVKGDKEQLGQVASILIDNAINHTKPHGKIQVSLNTKRGKVLFCVSNPGEEIPQDKRDKIFDRFYRLDEARSSSDNHYGLGLSIARAIVTEHKGLISVECSEGWTTFTVTLETAA